MHPAASRYCEWLSGLAFPCRKKHGTRAPLSAVNSNRLFQDLAAHVKTSHLITSNRHDNRTKFDYPLTSSRPPTHDHNRYEASSSGTAIVSRCLPPDVRTTTRHDSIQGLCLHMAAWQTLLSARNLFTDESCVVRCVVSYKSYSRFAVTNVTACLGCLLYGG